MLTKTKFTALCNAFNRLSHPRFPHPVLDGSGDLYATDGYVALRLSGVDVPNLCARYGLAAYEVDESTARSIKRLMESEHTQSEYVNEFVRPDVIMSAVRPFNAIKVPFRMVSSGAGRPISLRADFHAGDADGKLVAILQPLRMRK